MTNKEAIRWFEKQLLCNQTRLATAYFKETFEKAIEALKIAERFDGAVEVEAGNNCDQPTFVGNENFIDYADNHKLYAVPKL